MNKDNNSPWQQIDYTLLFLIFLLLCISSIAIYSAQFSLPVHLREINFVLRQVMWYMIGAVAILATMILDFDRFKQISWYLYGFGIFLLLLLRFSPEYIGSYELAPIRNGAKSWFVLPGLGSIQPSEFMKIFLIISLSHIIIVHNEKYAVRELREDFILLGKILLTSLLPIAIVMEQPDLGTAMVLSAIVASLILVSGIRWRILFGAASTFSLAIFVLVQIYFRFPKFFEDYILDSYQLARFYGWLQPYEYAGSYGYHLITSLKAIGSGQLQGKGFNNGTVYFPEAHTDFIFTVIGEEYGFIGASIVVSVFFMVIYRVIHISIESHDPFGSFLCAGVIGMLTFQVFQNIGMTIGLLPITGIPLPFVSYGGSSLLTYMIAIGLVLNVASRTRKYMFD
ncbi:FtsW/RodA/SpoVE family cell cycle protein [Bacillus taeanensis]|uniref:Rod shape-determining protein RodA n=1 Tax=Bacillus taeanensis TaxID=273032 RepID=A0A366XUZ7_9BACI|nr:FtsW/RodA/SpoVE family cell cycle protein [Bacillus taeanensis]RBW69952.1 rod shape-determining protein RodA [Bacillus taeanensis]